MGKCVKPMPVPAIPRGWYFKIHNFSQMPLAHSFNCFSVSLYGSIVDTMPQYSRTDTVPPDRGVLDFLGGPKLSPGQSGSSETSPYLPYALHPGASSASLLYSTWLGTGADKNASHLFGLQGKEVVLNVVICKRGWFLCVMHLHLYVCIRSFVKWTNLCPKNALS